MYICNDIGRIILFFSLVLSPLPSDAVLFLLFDYSFFFILPNDRPQARARKREETAETESPAIRFDTRRLFLVYEFVRLSSSSSNQFNFDRIDTACMRR
jgi:hypothetical protein